MVKGLPRARPTLIPLGKLGKDTPVLPPGTERVAPCHLQDKSQALSHPRLALFSPPANPPSLTLPVSGHLHLLLPSLRAQLPPRGPSLSPHWLLSHHYITHYNVNTWFPKFLLICPTRIRDSRRDPVQLYSSWALVSGVALGASGMSANQSTGLALNHNCCR